MLKVTASAGQRSELMQICDIFRAKIIDVAPGSVNIEMTGNGNKVTAFLNLVEPYGIIEMALRQPRTQARIISFTLYHNWNYISYYN